MILHINHHAMVLDYKLHFLWFLVNQFAAKIFSEAEIQNNLAGKIRRSLSGHSCAVTILL